LRRQATPSVIAGTPPADSAQPFGINGMIVTVAIDEKQAPSAPMIPNFCSKIPGTRACTATTPQLPGTRWLPHTKKRVHPENQWAVLDIRNQRVRFVLEPFLISEKQKHEQQGCPDEVVIDIPLQDAELR